MKMISHAATDICDYLGGQMYPALRLAFCPITYKPPSSNDEMNSRHAELCNVWTHLRQICPLPAMMQAIQLSPMVLDNPLEERQTIVCLD
jgi:hypothetical protein